MQPPRPHVRMLIVAGVAAFSMLVVAGRLAWLQLIRYSEYLGRAQRQQQRIVEVTPRRGSIYDRNLHPLAMSVPVDSCFAVPAEIKDSELAARLLSSVLSIPPEVLEARLDPARSFVWIARKLPPEKVQAISNLNLRGIYFQKENQRFYPKRELASHVLGYVDLDEKGLAGIEYALDGRIRGKGEKILVMSDAKRRWFDASESSREAGASVVLTLDEKIQYIAERELAAAIARTHAIAGTVIVQNPANGELLAVANWPSFNPNAVAESSPEAHMNRAVAALYEPGSTFKLITLAAAFEERITRPEEVFDCQNGAVFIAGHRIRDHKPFGLLPVSQILAKSSDVGAIKIALRLGAPSFYEYIRAFGFGSPTGVDLPGESKGLLRRLENWTPVSVASIAMGQEIGVTPIQLTAVVSAIANGGLLYKPRIVQEVRRAENAAPPALPAVVGEPKRVIRPETAATLRRLMEGVILDGTGKLARLDGWTAAGKTGSAQKIDPVTGRYSPTQLIASFTGFAPINSPAVTILISLDSPVGLREGGQVAAPVFKRIAEQVLAYLDVPRDVPRASRMMQASYRGQTSAEEGALADFTPADFSTQPEAAPLESNDQAEAKPQAPAVTVAVDEGGDISVPALRGKTMREVTRECLRLGLDPVLIGTGVATVQSPEAGSRLRRGNKIVIRFGTRLVLDGREGTRSPVATGKGR
jgi:cell division protein FtsI (penicillin-binding protein 3)